MWIVTGMVGAVLLSIGIGSLSAPHAPVIRVLFIVIGAVALGAVFGKCAETK